MLSFERILALSVTGRSLKAMLSCFLASLLHDDHADGAARIDQPDMAVESRRRTVVTENQDESR